MKRWEKAATRFEFLRQAAFQVVLRDGPSALSRRGLAAEVGMSEATIRRHLDAEAPLASLAATECETRRRRALLTMDRSRPKDQQMLDLLLPTEDRLDVEVVWLRLLLAHGVVESGADGDDLRARFQVADRGWSDEVPATGPVGPTAAAVAARTAITGHHRDRQASLHALVARHVGDRPDDVDTVLALVDGLVLAACEGRLTVARARAVLATYLDGYLDGHLEPVRSRTGDAAPAGRAPRSGHDRA